MIPVGFFAIDDELRTLMLKEEIDVEDATERGAGQGTDLDETGRREARGPNARVRGSGG